MFFPKQNNKQKQGIPNIELIYYIIGFVIFAVLLLNLEVNFFWLRDFASTIRGRSLEHQMLVAEHAAWMMEKEASLEVDGVEKLAQDLATVGEDSPLADIFVERFLKSSNHSREVSLIEVSGKEKKRFSREHSYEESELRDFSFLEQFEKAKEGQTYLGKVNYSNYAEPYILISTPIRKFGEEEVRGVLEVQYFLRGMWEIALETKVGGTGRVMVVDDKGMLVADPQPSRVLKKINLLNIPPTKDLLSKKQYSGGHYLNEKGVEVVGVGKAFNVGPMTWGLIVEQDASEMENPIKEVSKWLTVFLFSSVAIIGVLVWLIFLLRRTNQDLLVSQYGWKLERDKVENEKNKTESIISNFVDPVIVIDSNWKISLINPAARNIFGLSENDLGKRIKTAQGRFSFNDFRGIIPINYEVKELEFDSRGFPVVEEVSIGRPSYSKEKILSNALTGEMPQGLIYKVITRSVYEKDRICYGHMKIFYDLTREKTIDRMKSDFISIVAHQLRTPLSAIKWAVSMVANGDAGAINEEQKAFLDKAYASNERMINLVNDLLNVSRIEEGKFGFVFTKGDLQEVFNVVLANVEGMVARKHIQITLEKPKDMPKVYLDKEKMVLALQNILDNAIKYTNDYGQIKILISEKEKNLEVRIRDNGIGIPKIDQQRIFTKFFRSSNVVKMETEGSGLGLFIVKNIIERHNGRIKLISEEGKGTEVMFTLPID